MRRILMMVLNNLLYLIPLAAKLLWYSWDNDTHTDEERHKFLQWIVYRANKGGKVKIEASGQENLPEKDGFILYPNHQGLYDILAMVDTCDRPFSVVMKQEIRNIPFIKQVYKIMRAKAIDRDDVRQGMKIILEVTEEVKNGRNYLIFAEGTRSKVENVPQDFKGGSFKAAMKAKCPIVPVAIVDAFKPFDRKDLSEVTVQIRYLKPLYYEEYKDMKSTELASHVKELVTEEINNCLAEM